eukprot:SAG31_NODE_1363_length_8627_cov_5.967402_5_plen_108_part_00
MQELKAGVRVTGCPTGSLNTTYKHRGQFAGFPLYLSEDQQGLYFYEPAKRWFLYRKWNEEDANKRMANARINADVRTGQVPLGQQMWNCYRAGGWYDASFWVDPVAE